MQNQNLNSNVKAQDQNGSSETRIPIVSDMLDKYDMLWQTFIRPPKKAYPIECLGPQKKKMDENISYERHDSAIKNHKNLKQEYSVFNIRGPKTAILPKDCMIYLHSHGGNRTEGTFILKHTYKLGLNVCLFDFSGSGCSEGEYVTLGYEEQYDIDDIITHQKMNYGFEKFYIWGRSMGSVAALMYAEKNPQDIEFMILDSPFSSIINMVNDASKTYVTLPDFVVEMLFSIVTGSCCDRIGYDLSLLKPVDCAKNIKNIYSIFVVAKDDKLVLPVRVKEIYDNYQGPKQFQVVDGEHQTSRSANEIEKIFQYVKSFIYQKNALSNIKKTSYPRRDVSHKTSQNTYSAIGQILPSKNLKPKNFFNEQGGSNMEQNFTANISQNYITPKHSERQSEKMIKQDTNQFRRNNSKSSITENHVKNLSKNQYATEKQRAYRKSYNQKDNLSYYNNEANHKDNNSAVRNNKIFDGSDQKFDFNKRNNSRTNAITMENEPSNSTNIPLSENGEHFIGNLVKEMEFTHKMIPKTNNVHFINQGSPNINKMPVSRDTNFNTMPQNADIDIFTTSSGNRTQSLRDNNIPQNYNNNNRNPNNNLINNLQKENKLVDNHQSNIGNFSNNYRDNINDQYNQPTDTDFSGSFVNNKYENKSFKQSFNSPNNQAMQSFHSNHNENYNLNLNLSETHRENNSNPLIIEKQRKNSLNDFNQKRSKLDNMYLNINPNNINSGNNNNSQNSIKHTNSILDQNNYSEYFNKSNKPQTLVNPPENLNYKNNQNNDQNKMNGNNYNQKILTSISNNMVSTPKKPPLLSNGRIKPLSGNGNNFKQKIDNSVKGPTLNLSKIGSNNLNRDENQSRQYSNQRTTNSPNYSRINTNVSYKNENAENNQSFRRNFSLNKY